MSRIDIFHSAVEAKTYLINMNRGQAFNGPITFSEYSGTDAMLFSQKGDRVQLSEKVRGVAEIAIPYLQEYLGELGEAVFTQRRINVRPGEGFIPCMARMDALPNNLRSNPMYLRWFELVEQSFTKNGYVRLLREHGMDHIMPATTLYAAGAIPHDAPYPKFWAKLNREIKFADSKSVIMLHADDPDWRMKLVEFLEQAPEDEYQIQQHIENGAMRSPHYTVQANAVRLDVMAHSIIVDNHHQGSSYTGKEPQQGPNKVGLMIGEFLRGLGYRSFMNPDVLVSPSGDWNNENNFRPGGSHGPDTFAKRMGWDTKPWVYWRDCLVGESLSTQQVFDKAKELNVHVYLWGGLARPDLKDRRVGLMARGKNARAILENAMVEIAQA